MQTFLWHDYETFGISPCQDRPAQFAAIRTDSALNPIGEPLTWYCQPAGDYLPDPEACLLTGITPQHCLTQGVPENAFARHIFQAMTTPETISVGYNSYQFDDEVSRFLFWRNLMDPYAREWQNQCGRWDLLNLVRATWALRPDGIQWPTHDDGRASFRLEQLTAANQIHHGHAHDALSDVEATVALARLIREQQPRLFDFCLALRDKTRVQEHVDLLNPRPFLHISGMIPVERGCMMLAWPVAAHPTNKNEIIIWDLAFDPDELFTIDVDDAARRLFSKKEALTERGETRLPLKTIHLNRAPIVVSQLKTLSPQQAERYGIDLSRQLAHAAKFAHAPNLSVLWQSLWQRDYPPQDIDCDLYNGFIGNSDRRLLDRLREMDGDTLKDQTPWFEDKRLDELLFRYQARHFPDSLDKTSQHRWTTHCRDRLLQGKQNARTVQQVFNQIERLADKELTDHQENLLGEIYDYTEGLAEQVSQPTN